MGILIGYMRVSKVDGSQELDLPKDALLAAGVEGRYLYQDRHLAHAMTSLGWRTASKRYVLAIR